MIMSSVRRRVNQGNRGKSAQRRIWNDMALGERMRTIERNDESELKPKLATPVSRDNGIKTDVVVVIVVVVDLLQ